jgi:hypothetical protein
VKATRALPPASLTAEPACVASLTRDSDPV